MASTTTFISLDGVALLADPAHTQALNLIDTLGNTYIAKHQWQSDKSLIVGVGFRSYKRDELDVNTSLRLLPFIKMQSQGDVLQLNSPRFRNLAYTYDINSRLLFVDNIVRWTKHRLRPGLIVGLGGASNTASHYHETPLSAHATPSLDHFTGQTQLQLAYELGAVLDYAFQDVIIECAYRYIDAGQGQLGLSPLQNTQMHLLTGPLRYHAISLGVRFEQFY